MAEPPDPGPLLQLTAGIVARRLPFPILHLAGVGGRADVDVEALAVDRDRVHRVSALRHQAGHDHLGLAGRNRIAFRHPIADNGAVGLRIELVAVQGDPGAAFAAGFAGAAEAADHIGSAIAVGVAQRDQKAACRHPPSGVIGRVPGVGVDGSTRTCREVTGRAKVLREDRRGETRGELELHLAGSGRGALRRTGLVVSEAGRLRSPLLQPSAIVAAAARITVLICHSPCRC